MQKRVVLVSPVQKWTEQRIHSAALPEWLNSSFTVCTALVPEQQSAQMYLVALVSLILSRSHGGERWRFSDEKYCLGHFDDHPLPLHRHARMHSTLSLCGQTAEWPEILLWLFLLKVFLPVILSFVLALGTILSLPSLLASAWQESVM